jgi:outer membrane protein OmpA-like peptidoglycan-associated protein
LRTLTVAAFARSNVKPSSRTGAIARILEEVSMGLRCFPKILIAGIVLASAVLLPALCLAQEEMDPANGEPNVNSAGCADLTALSKLPSSVIVSCDNQNIAEVTMPLNPDAQGNGREKSIRGAYEFREYQILERDQQEQAFDTLTRLLGIAGFTVKFSSSPSTITGRNQDTWILVKVSGEYYDVSVVRSTEDPWTPVKNAQEISREMETHKRVAIYGIEFSPDNQAVVEENSKILGEVLTYLKGNSGLAIDVESYKTSINGSAEDDQEITRKRAKAVAGWLEAHGIAAGRLQPKAFGRNKPITENDTPMEVQRNERIELAKTAPRISLAVQAPLGRREARDVRSVAAVIGPAFLFQS